MHFVNRDQLNTDEWKPDSYNVGAYINCLLPAIVAKQMGTTVIIFLFSIFVYIDN